MAGAEPSGLGPHLMQPTAPCDADLDLPGPWRDAAAAALAAQGVVMVVGGVDSGKSTFCRYLLGLAQAQRRLLAFLDADLGQSHLGPPGTLGLQLYPTATPAESGLSADACYFIGQTSPAGCLLEVVLGLRRLVDDYRWRRRLIIVNTSGFVSGPVAVRLKAAKAEALEPDLCILLRRGDELAAVAPPLQRRSRRTLVLPVSPLARSKSWEERRRYRQERWAAYFAGAQPLRLAFSSRCWLGFPFGQGRVLPPQDIAPLQEMTGIPIWHAERGGGHVYLVAAAALPEAAQAELGNYLAPDRFSWLAWPSLHSRLVGLLDRSMYLRSLGIIQEVDWQTASVTLLTPCPAAWLPQISFLRLGRLRLDPTGQELPPP